MNATDITTNDTRLVTEWTSGGSVVRLPRPMTAIEALRKMLSTVNAGADVAVIMAGSFTEYERPAVDLSRYPGNPGAKVDVKLTGSGRVKYVKATSKSAAALMKWRQEYYDRWPTAGYGTSITDVMQTQGGGYFMQGSRSTSCD